MVKLFIDGGCRGNDQRDIAAREMFYAVSDEHGTILYSGATRGGSNNIAELYAVVSALRYCREKKVAPVTIYTDSRNNLSWVLGKKVGKHINDRETVLRLKAEIAELSETIGFSLKWVPREQNLAGHYLESTLGV